MTAQGKIIRIGGHEFNEVTGIEGQKVLIPRRPPDDMKEFPGNAELEGAGWLMRSGVAKHTIEMTFEKIEELRPAVDAFVEGVESLNRIPLGGVRGRDLYVFSEDHWYGECFGVLHAHGWLGPGGRLADHIIEHVVERHGQAEIDKAKAEYGTEWEVYVKELAAVTLAKPLSRLWYAANMMALYYIHYDDMRLGYLWAEYKMRLQHERDSFRGKKSVESARGGGKERARQFSNQRGQVLAAMEHYVDRGNSVSNAARLAHKGGIGASAEANRRLWNRHHPK